MFKQKKEDNSIQVHCSNYLTTELKKKKGGGLWLKKYTVCNSVFDNQNIILSIQNKNILFQDN